MFTSTRLSLAKACEVVSRCNDYDQAVFLSVPTEFQTQMLITAKTEILHFRKHFLSFFFLSIFCTKSRWCPSSSSSSNLPFRSIVAANSLSPPSCPDGLEVQFISLDLCPVTNAKPEESSSEAAICAVGGEVFGLYQTPSPGERAAEVGK
jgi:hypothetical protein